MKIFISDIHLTDSHKHQPIKLPRLFDLLNNLTKKIFEANFEEVEIVLLGDIFDFIKSDMWLNNHLRPWEDCTPHHVETVTNIFQSIYENNLDFFNQLAQYLSHYQFVKIVYIPGNHDRVINTTMGENARSLLLSRLPNDNIANNFFRENYIDADLGIIASHGHEFDSNNRYSSKGAAFGDAIVIELLMRLPLLVSQYLNIPAANYHLDFIYEIDNVRPQHPRIIAKWLLTGIEKFLQRFPDARTAFQKALIEITERLSELLKSNIFEINPISSWWMRFLYTIIKLALSRIGFLRTAAWLPVKRTRNKVYYSQTIEDLIAVRGAGESFKFAIYGHTHLPEIVPLQISDAFKSTPIYMNTGTWKNTKRIADFPDDKSANFITWQEECVICIYNPDELEAGFPQYEFNRYTFGE
jgi:UDP-2,3-diacylglucosamine pyrophosphatase LpxH